MKNWNNCKLLLGLISILSGCGYRWQSEDASFARPTVTVPYVVGDEEGRLTASIIEALSTSRTMVVKPHGGDLRLEVTVVGHSSQQIGYRRDPQDVYNTLRKNLLASEGRRTLTTTITLYKGASTEVVTGPYQVSVYADYDYVDGDSLQDLTFINAQGQQQTVLPFSLGQLEPKEAAYDAAATPLYFKIAHKIADMLDAEWSFHGME